MCSRVAVWSSPCYVSRHTWTKHRPAPCARRSMYAIVCCIRAIGPIGGRPVDFISTPTTDRTVDQASGRETWWGSVHYFFSGFFSSFFTDRPGSTVAVFFAQLSLVGRRDVLLLYSVTKTTTGTTYHPRLFFAFASSPSRFFIGISFRFSGFCFYSTIHRHAV